MSKKPILFCTPCGAARAHILVGIPAKQRCQTCGAFYSLALPTSPAALAAFRAFNPSPGLFNDQK